MNNYDIYINGYHITLDAQAIDCERQVRLLMMKRERFVLLNWIRGFDEDIYIPLIQEFQYLHREEGLTGKTFFDPNKRI